jgi:hypothetical protein
MSMHGDINLLCDSGAGSARDPGPHRGKLMCMPHPRHVTGEASRLREQMQVASSRTECFATPCQSDYSLRAGLPHPRTARCNF